MSTASALSPLALLGSAEDTAVLLLAGATALLALLLAALLVGYARLRHAERELRQSEERWRTMAENVPDFVVLIDRAFRITFINRPGQGYKAEQVIGSDVLDYLGAEERNDHRETFQGVFERGAIADLETRARGSPDEWRWYRVRIAPVRKGGTIVGALMVATDLTERKQAEEQLARAQKLESIGLLAGGVAHDFNNMLTAINGNCSLLLRNMPDDHPWRDIVSDVFCAGERAANLTRQLLAFSRRQVLHPRVVDLNHIIDGMKSMLARTIGPQITLRVELQPDLGPVRADPAQLEQVLVNLALNARDAMSHGGSLTLITDEIAVGANSPEAQAGILPGPYRRLRVIDTGRGMAEDERKRVFEPFFTTKEQGKGTGLGLATVYGVVRQSGGHILVDSAPGRGTTFSVYLPACAGEANVPAATNPRPGLTQGTGTVLMVEDEDSVRVTLQRILELCGYEVLTAANAQEALTASREHAGPIDLLVTDVLMPHTSGSELANLLLRERPSLRVLFISGFAAGQSDVLQGAPFLQKPFTSAALADKVREVLSSQT